jgi:hypothetical protein
LVRRFVEESDVRVFSFWWEVDGTENNVFVPHIVFQMDTGKGENGPVPSSLSQEAGMALWDKVSSSIRFHHTSPAQVANPLPPTSAPAT